MPETIHCQCGEEIGTLPDDTLPTWWHWVCPRCLKEGTLFDDRPVPARERTE